VCNDPIAMINIFKRLKEQVLPYIEMSKGIPEFYLKLKTMMFSSINIIESLQLAADIDYLVNSKFKKDCGAYIAGRVALCAAHAGVCCQWLVEAGLMQKIAESIVKIRLLTTAAFGISYACFAIDAAMKLSGARTIVSKGYAQHELAKNVSELALSTMMIFGNLNMIFLCAMSCVCIAFNISCAVYKQGHKPL